METEALSPFPDTLSILDPPGRSSDRTHLSCYIMLRGVRERTGIWRKTHLLWGLFLLGCQTTFFSRWHTHSCVYFNINITLSFLSGTNTFSHMARTQLSLNAYMHKDRDAHTCGFHTLASVAHFCTHSWRGTGRVEGVVAAGQTGRVMQQTDPPCWISINLAPHTQFCSKLNTGSLHTIPSS